MALCSLHHKLFDRGVISISEKREMLGRLSPILRG
ncbi:hypothetical protein H8B09_19680 [Paenibacillus sp. PR3]|uniref:HNH endonuclease n=1 Tax=Paenibacillus terricola TaxID=2763503 RepID=A0ABR8MYJ5_9BACL|nr:hypothetical protein [Paenibacillus terricola]